MKKKTKPSVSSEKNDRASSPSPSPVPGAPTEYELATLAARIAPGICQQAPGDAITAALKLIESARDVMDSNLAEKENLEAAERFDDEIGHLAFEPGVKFITANPILVRAMPWFRKFLRSRSASEKVFEAALTTVRANGFTSVQGNLLRRDFAAWKRPEKSRLAKASRAARSKK